MFPESIRAFHPDAHVADPGATPRRPWWKRRAWAWALLLPVLGFAWLSWRLPLDRALEPLPEATLVLLDAQGRPFARRGQ